MGSIGAAAANRAILSLMLLGHQDNVFFSAATWVALKIFSTFAGITIFFLIYWLLPNGKVRPRSVLPVAIVMGVLWDASKYIYIKLLPKLDFREVYGPFSISVSLMFWAFLS